MAGDPRRSRRSGPATSTPSPPSPPTATSPASTSTTSSSPSPTAATRGRRRARTGWPSSSELADRLHADGRTLTVSIPPVYDAGQTDDSGYWVYDYARHHAARRQHPGDGLRLLGAVRRRRPDRPARRGSTGSSPARRAASGDPSKLVLGVPLYGYNWPVGDDRRRARRRAEGVTVGRPTATVDELAARRGATPVFDPATYEWSFTYDLVVDDGTTSCTQQREVHYVDADGAQHAHAARRRRRLRRRRRCSPSATTTTPCGTPSTPSPPS